MNSNGGIMKLALVCIAIMVGLIDHNARAATNTWGNTATNWNDPASWVGGQPGSGDTAVFTNTTPAFQPNITTSTTISNLQFRAGNWTLSSDSPTTLTLLGTGTTTNSALYSATGNNTISAPLIFGAAAAQTINAAAGTLLISGNITKSDASNLNFSATGDTTVSGNISAGGRVTVSGAAGGLTLSGNNSVGGWDIGSGAITLDSAGALGLSGTINWTGSGGLILTASNNTDYSSRFTVNSGVSYTVGAKSGVTVTLATALAGNGTSGFKTGGSQNSGTIILGNAGNSFGGSVSVNGGALSVAGIGNAGNNSYLGTNGTINLGGSATGGKLIYTGAGETSDKIINLAGTTGGGTIQADNTSGVLKFTSAITSAINSGTNRTLTLQGAGIGEMAGAIVDGSTTNTTLLTKAGTGLWTLRGSNTYSGVTTVSGGALRLNNTNAIPGGIAGGTTNLVISGGVVELGVGDFTRDLGTGAQQVQITSSGGFSAYGGKRVANLGGTTNLVSWDAGSFLTSSPRALILSSIFADSEIEFQNPINLGAAARTIQVDDNTATNTDFATLSGVVTNGALVKTGEGKLVLAGTTNRFTTTTGLVVSNGTLVVQGVTTGSVLTVAGGTALLNGPFTGPVKVGASGALGGTGTVAMANLTLTNGAVTATILDNQGNSEYLTITGAALNLTNLTLNVVNPNRLAYGQSYWVVKCAHSNAFIPPSLPAEWVLDYRDAAGVKIRSTRYSGTMLKIQ